MKIFYIITQSYIGESNKELRKYIVKKSYKFPMNLKENKENYLPDQTSIEH